MGADPEDVEQSFKEAFPSGVLCERIVSASTMCAC